MANFYERMQTISTNLINKFGASCQLVSYDSDGAQVVLSTQNGVAGTIKQDDYVNSLDEKAEGVVYIAPITVVPDTTHYLVWNGVVHKIIYVDIYKPANKEVLYGLYIRK